MKLRIISGKLKSRIIVHPEKGKVFRPTLERTRESVAEILKPIIQDSIVADLCAGSGAFGFEMLSRGAARVDFVEQKRFRAELIRSNAEVFGVSAQCRIFVQDVKVFVKNAHKNYGLIFYDPPYDRDDLKRLIPDIMELLSHDGVLVYERSRGLQEDGFPENIKPYDVRMFGDTLVEFYQPLSGTDRGKR